MRNLSMPRIRLDFYIFKSIPDSLASPAQERLLSDTICKILHSLDSFKHHRHYQECLAISYSIKCVFCFGSAATLLLCLLLAQLKYSG